MVKHDSHIEYFKLYKNALSEIKNISVKYPKYINHLVQIYMKHSFQDGSLEMIKSIYRKQVEYNHVFKNEYFSLLNHDNIEIIEDLMQSILITHNAKKLANSLVSQKNKKIISPEVYLLFRYFVEKKYSKSFLQKKIGKQIARFKDSIEFENFIKSFILSFDTITMNTIEEKVKNLNAIIINNSDNKLVLQILDYETSKTLGSPSWCISYKKEYWDNYNENKSIMSLIGIMKKKQYFIWDFNKNSYDKEFLIGITTINNNIDSAYYKDNSNIDKEKIKKEYSYLLNEKNISHDELLNRINKLNIKEFLKESMIDHINRLKEKN